MNKLKDSININEEVLGEKIYLVSQFMGDDLSVLVYGGEKSHIGSISIAEPRESLTGEGKSATVSTFVFSGHKDDIIGNYFAKKLSKELETRVVVNCGIHYNNLSLDDIKNVDKSCKEILKNLLEELK